MQQDYGTTHPVFIIDINYCICPRKKRVCNKQPENCRSLYFQKKKIETAVVQQERRPHFLVDSF